MINIVIGFLIYMIIALSFLLAKIHGIENNGGHLTKDDCVDCVLWPLYTIVAIAMWIIKLTNNEEVD